MTRTASIAMAGSATRRARLPVWLAWSGVALYAVLVLATIALGDETDALALDLLFVTALLACAVVGALIVGSQPRHPIGWMFVGLAVSFGLQFATRAYAVRALVASPGSVPAGEAAWWFSLWIDLPGVAAVALFLPLLFPDGRLPSRRWRPVAWIAGAAVVVTVLLRMVSPRADAKYPTIRNPIGLDAYSEAFDAVGLLLDPLLLLLVVLCALALFDRVRRADDVQRHQVKWFAYAGALVLLSFLIAPLSGVFPSLAATRDVVTVVAIVALPTAVGIAVLRYRLYDIDLIINRTVVYVLLTAILAGVYTGAVAFFQRFLVAVTGQSSDLAIVMTLFVLATVFTPIKNTLQENVDRRIKPRKAALSSHAPSGVDDLLMLAELHDRGVLTEDEFAAKKKQILGL